jgi:hypothetical protein
VNENTRLYEPLQPQKTRIIQHELGFYGTDSWRIHPQLTINYGLRWELQFAPVDPKSISFRTVGGYPGVWGISGLNNLFKPGTTTGSISVFELNGNRRWYETDMNNFAPNLGIAWSPSFNNKLWKGMFGEAGKTIFRAAYSVNYTREGTNNFSSIAFSNPGIDGSIFANPVAPGTTAGNNCTGITPPFTAAGTFPAGCLTYNGLLSGDLQSLLTNPPAFPTAPFQILAQSGQSVNMFEPNLGTPIVHNWSVGIQREISPSMVVEVRYVGNHGAGLWKQVNLNEVNIYENGFLVEFGNALSNLNICRATPACVTAGVRFSNQGFAGQVPVPIMTQMFTGTTAGSQTSSNFSSATFIRWLDNGAVGSFAGNVAFNTNFLCNLVGVAPLQGASLTNPCLGVTTASLVATSFPVNFWAVNPHAGAPPSAATPSFPNGGAFRINNDTHTNYNGLTVEARKRMSHGLQFQANYTFSKALTNYYANSSVNFANFTSLRNPGFDKGPSPWDIRHAFKLNMIYDFPFGPGKRWSSSHAWWNRVIEGWGVSALTRWQSGGVFQLTGGNDFLTVNQYDPGVILKGITPNQIQNSLTIRKLPNGQVFWFPAALIGSNGQANTSFIAPCNTAGQLCQKVFLYGPQFFRADISVIKRVRIHEQVGLEYRAVFLNAFNNINFLAQGQGGGTHAVTSSTFGRITSAFQDPNATDDFGGRIIEMQFRINF